ncbi:carbonic anhydrase [Candidatus Marithrix sp. Canyon 246]|uniref:carbonic anhydrase n=1 Tax=Candidatus Marithrix sp. Canyon 246 TaxID=1827136 RepID=UPI00084A2982|nr:carbonic anhydrase family protein [Candidatus Marithrix sp. Canyon 246]
MKKSLIILASTLLINGCQSEHWGYSGDESPKHWGDLHKNYSLCSSGKNQSPINLTNLIESDLAAIEFNYGTLVSDIVNNGHTVQANYAAGSSITLNGHSFDLKQFHFHTPSENHINGKSYPMEAHLVHADKAGNLAVVAVMFEQGDANSAMADLWKQIPKKAGDKHSLSSKVNASNLLPENKDYYRFNGSLTTPPCTEGVLWLVMKNSVSVSKQQIETFSNVIHHANNRPIQAINARPVLQ